MSACMRDAAFIVGKKKPHVKEATLDVKKAAALKQRLAKYEVKK